MKCLVNAQGRAIFFLPLLCTLVNLPRFLENPRWHLKIRDLRPLQKKYPEIRQILFAGVRQHIVDTYHEVRLSGCVWLHKARGILVCLPSSFAQAAQAAQQTKYLTLYPGMFTPLCSIDHKDSDWKENAAPSDGEGPTNVIPTLPLTPSKQRWRKAAQHFCLGKYRPVAVEDLDKKMELPGLGRIAVKVLMQLGRFEHEAKDWPPPLPEETGPSPGNELRGIAGNASREKLTSSSNVPPTTDHASNQCKCPTRFQAWLAEAIA